MDENTPAARIIEGYVKWLESLTAAGCHRIAQFIAREARYRTPESETTGPDGLGSLYKRMFDGAADIKIRVLDRAPGSDGHTVYLRWDRLTTMDDGQFRTLSGMTEVMTGMDGKIVSIVDYWDSMPDIATRRGFFARLFGR